LRRNLAGVTARPMRPWENALALVAAFLVAGALLPWDLRLACALGAIGIIVLMLLIRIRSHQIVVTKKRTAGVYGQIDRLRAERKERYRKTR
jgi:hypothetical protein